MSAVQKIELETPKVFLPLLQPARYLGAYGGRGSGKSYFMAELIVERCLSTPKTRFVCIREVQKSLKDSAKRLIEDRIEDFGAGKLFEIRHDHIKTPGGGIILFQGMSDHTAESIKSLEGMDGAWVEEAQTLSERSLELLRPTIRKPGSTIMFSWNPRNAADPVDELLRGPELPPDSIVVKANYSDNPHFPKELEAERLYDLKTKPDRYAHIWLGDYEPAAVGAIWDRQTLHAGRLHETPEDLARIVVGVDPAISSEKGSDEHGIIVAGLAEDSQRAFVLDDLSLKGVPRQWAARAVAAFDKWDADAIVIERNQGGDMVRHTLESVRPDLPIIEVVATRGKHVRAEPISAQYALGRVSHVGTFPELEQQMCLMTAAGYEGVGSPDRVDAMVWALTELFPDLNMRPRKKKATRTVQAHWLGA